MIHNQAKEEGSVSHQFPPSDDDDMQEKIDPLDKEMNISEIEASIRENQGPRNSVS